MRPVYRAGIGLVIAKLLVFLWPNKGGLALRILNLQDMPHYNWRMKYSGG